MITAADLFSLGFDKVQSATMLDLIDNAEHDEALDYANGVMKGYGIESVAPEHAWVSSYYGNIIALYVNMGDTYDATVLYDTEQWEFHVTSWGDFYEEWETENPSPDCPQCGETRDRDCSGEMRCPDCDGPCPCCADQNEETEDDKEMAECDE